MSHVVRETPWCVIDIDTSAGSIFLQERWFYVWKCKDGQPAWTVEEKRNFHNRADRAIWATWSFRVKLRAHGASAFARKFKDCDIGINFDIRWVLTGGHWTVTVTKIPADQQETSFVRWNDRQISLDTNDVNERKRTRGGRDYKQFPVAHEFGHAVGNTSVLGRGDEYGADHAHKDDRASIMNVGNSLRVRHFDTVIAELDQMIPDTTFTVRAV